MRTKTEIVFDRIADMRVRDVRELGRMLAKHHPGLVAELEAGFIEEEAGLDRHKPEPRQPQLRFDLEDRVARSKLLLDDGDLSPKLP